MRLMCCLSAAWVGWMFSRVLDFCLKSCFLASFTSVLSLVQSYISTTNRSSGNIDPSRTSLGMHRSSSNASFTSGKDVQVFQAVFFPLPANADTVSHPVEACSTGRVRHCDIVLDSLWQPFREYLCTENLIRHQRESTADQELSC